MAQRLQQRDIIIKKTLQDSTENQYVRLSGKAPLRLLVNRPPNFETPLKYFREDLTPNEVFFVRWHLAGLPKEVDSNSFRLKVDGNAGHHLSQSLHI